MAETDWTAIKTAYVTGTMSMQKLAQDSGVSYKTMRNRAAAEGWTKERTKYRTKLGQRAQARAQASELKRLEKLQSAGTRMCNQLEKLMKNASKELYTHVALESTGKGRSHLIEKKLSVVDSKKLSDITKAIDTMSRAMRNLYDIQTAAEKAQTAAALARARDTEDKAIDGIEITYGDERLEDFAE